MTGSELKNLQARVDVLERKNQKLEKIMFSMYDVLMKAQQIIDADGTLLELLKDRTDHMEIRIDRLENTADILERDYGRRKTEGDLGRVS